MRFFKPMGAALLCGAMLFSLTGCAEGDTPTGQPAATQNNQVLICYGYDNGDYDGVTRVFNSEGKLIAKTGGSRGQNYEDVWTIYDDSNEPAGLALINRTYSTEEFEAWGSPVITGVNYNILDLDGNEVCHVTIDNPGDINVMAPKGVTGDIIFFNFISADETEDGVAYYEVYDSMGEPILTEKLTVDSDTVDFENTDNNFAYADYNGELLIINHDVWDEFWANNYRKCYVFAKQYGANTFTAKQLDKDYYDIHRVYNNNGGGSLAYWQAQYYPTPGTPMYDILNPDGTIAIEGLNSILNSGGGMIFGKIGNELVLLDMQGNRLYTESAYNSLDD